MRNYTSPEMNVMTFMTKEAIAAALEGSKTTNDGELEW